MSRPTKCYINLTALKSNVMEIRKKIGNRRLLVTAKADCYGHGMEKAARYIDGLVDYFGVATVEEGAMLKGLNIKAAVLHLGPLNAGDEEDCVQNGIEQAVSDIETVRLLENAGAKYNKTVNIHIKLETGMHRTGIRCNEELLALLDEIKQCKFVKLNGVFTHFAAADTDKKEYTKMQAEEFIKGVELIKGYGFNGIIVHCANSAAIIKYPEYYFDMVRAGIITYGYYPSEEVPHLIDIKPVFSLKTCVEAINTVKKGEKIGYSGTYTAKKDMRVAVLPIGYGDGYRRGLSNIGEVLICGKRARIVGNICMDMTMVDVTDIPECTLMSEAVLIGEQGNECITADELAKKLNTISYEIMLSVNQRVPKIFIE